MPIVQIGTTPTIFGNEVISGTLTLQQTIEQATISASAAGGTINFYFLNQAILYYTSAATSNWTLNITGNNTTTLNSLMSVGQVITLVFLNTNGSTAYYQTGLQIDGATVASNWYGNSVINSGNANAIDVYSITIIKTGNATYTVLETQSTF